MQKFGRNYILMHINLDKNMQLNLWLKIAFPSPSSLLDLCEIRRINFQIIGQTIFNQNKQPNFVLNHICPGKKSRLEPVSSEWSGWDDIVFIISKLKSMIKKYKIAFIRNLMYVTPKYVKVYLSMCTNTKLLLKSVLNCLHQIHRTNY